VEFHWHALCIAFLAWFYVIYAHKLLLGLYYIILFALCVHRTNEISSVLYNSIDCCSIRPVAMSTSCWPLILTSKRAVATQDSAQDSVCNTPKQPRVSTARARSLSLKLRLTVSSLIRRAGSVMKPSGAQMSCNQFPMEWRIVFRSEWPLLV